MTADNQEARTTKLGLLLACAPGSKNFQHGTGIAEAARKRGLGVYLYCIDEAVRAIKSPELQKLKAGGVRLFACAYSLQKRNLPLSESATLVGLTVLNDIITSTDRFLAFT